MNRIVQYMNYIVYVIQYILYTIAWWCGHMVVQWDGSMVGYGTSSMRSRSRATKPCGTTNTARLYVV